MTLPLFFDGMKKIANGIILVVTCLFAITAAGGMILYGNYTLLFGPVWIMNQFIGLWFTSLLGFFSLTILYHFFHFQIVTFAKRQSTFCFLYEFANIIYYTVSALLILLMFIGYSLGGRVDILIWSLLCFLIVVVGFFMIVINNQRVVKEEWTEFHPGEQSAPITKTQNVIFGLDLVLTVMVWILKIASLIIMILLVNGAATFGIGGVSYPPKGVIASVTLMDGRLQKIHYYCTGPLNSTNPVMLLEADGSHGFADFFALQTLLAENGIRSCSWDKPGLGHSDYLYVGQFSPQTYYHQLIITMNETGPFAFIGWGGGASIIYEYAFFHPEMFHSMVMLDIYPEKSEWIIPYMVKNQTLGQYQAAMRADLDSRKTLFNVINGIGVPFGLMGLFIPYSIDSYPQSFENEKRWYFLTEKTWTTQRFWLDIAYSSPNVFEVRKVPNIPIHHILTRYNSSVVDIKCNRRRLSAADCLYEQKANEMLNEMKIKIFEQNGGKNIFCKEAECDLGYFVLGKPVWTVHELLKLYP